MKGFPQAASKNLITTKTFPIYSPIFDISCVTLKTLHVSDYLNFVSTLSFFVYNNPCKSFLFASNLIEVKDVTSSKLSTLNFIVDNLNQGSMFNIKKNNERKARGFIVECC